MIRLSGITLTASIKTSVIYHEILKQLDSMLNKKIVSHFSKELIILNQNADT